MEMNRALPLKHEHARQKAATGSPLIGYCFARLKELQRIKRA
jgi:hypothetical protein